MARVVLDVNVLVSALLRVEGAPARIVAGWVSGAFELIVSAELVAELTVVAARPRIARRLDQRDVRSLVEAIEAHAIFVDAPSVERFVPRDPEDDYLVALARAGGARAIVTGDRHLLDVERLEPRAMTPRAFLGWLERISP